jgi:hypothetical protein
MGKRGPAPKDGPGHTIGVRCQPEFLARLDRWRETQAVPPTTRTAALRYLAEIGLDAIDPKGGRATRRPKFSID